jgi:hypothetical protein
VEHGRHYDFLAVMAGIELESDTERRNRALAGYHGDVCDGARVVDTQLRLL